MAQVLADADGGQPSSSNLPPSSVAIKHSVDPVTRIHHSHGHTCREVWQLRKGQLPRVADAVVWPLTEDAVADVVAAAAAADVVLMPYGGGTSVTNALTLPERDAEPRPIVVVSMAKLNAVLDVDTVNMTATIQAGAVGAVLGKELADGWGVTMGHEPDSYEFSTLGGWIATRASGMQKNVYGNIEDIVISVTLVTPTGTVVKDAVVPRISAGPDIHHLVLGSEGTLGIITSAIVKVRPLPAVRKYGALIFPDFDAGVAAMYDIAQAHAAPASIRLVDNNQFQMGQALKPPTSWFASAIAAAKKFYVLSIKGFEADTMVAATLLFLGNSDADIAAQEAALYPIAARHGGMPADEENGRRGYALTFMIAYIRDLAFQYCFLAESFETSVPWSGVRHLCTSVKAAIVDAAAARSIPREPFVTCRVTQTYDTGACFDEIEHIARVAILDAGGSISHHHGIGKHRASFMPHVQSPAANAALRAVKRELDPTNVFASGNVLPAKL
ncbi:alkyl-dihydroxyacetonephosphate synthase [Thecamonas trahens ATCC 50062]|uniref:Alkylglycerone-phosphate synthase n=1 Tax=Thecamonas trahens ATCC 50062 TaxID=461836 RepID=A0A0L0D7F4_THETB|nr:alkyl-dihydroxyacetonephosphate synthase [Thecamonas trahens ATCC 50062]KNC48317.1 alkyl-dihydroxyacetonephosphate synthase [Thecamonas trahens ATCC 50062]|eukprot:XP_013758884.1 alkyl-dihydroxyacetonephosphate synthase [Thecamonas trahens ATCC 50062]